MASCPDAAPAQEISIMQHRHHRLFAWLRPAAPTAILALLVFALASMPAAARPTNSQWTDPAAYQVGSTETPTPTATETADPAVSPTPTATPGTPTPTATEATGTATSTPTATRTGDERSTGAAQCDESGDPTNAPDAYEPDDDSSGGATVLLVGANQTHTLCSTTTATDVDWFAFDGRIDQQVTITTGNLSAVVDTYVIVQGPNGFQMQNDDGGGGLGSLVSFTPATAGRYLIQVTQSSKTPFLRDETDQPRAYTIFLAGQTVGTPTPTATAVPGTPTPTGTPSICRDDYEPDNRRGSAQGLFVNSGQAHYLCGDGDVDWVWFDAVAGKPYHITTSDLASGVDTLMVLYAPDGETILEINDDYPGQGLASRVDLTAPETARYYLKVQDSAGHGGELFAYTLRLDSEGMATGACLDPHEPDDQSETAREILVGELQTHAFCPAGDVDWLTFYAVAGKLYTLTTGDLTIGTDTMIAVIGQDGATLAQDDDGAGGLASRAEFVAPTSGYYLAQVRNAGDIGGRGQRYTVALAAGGAGVISTPTPVPPTPTPTLTP
jgi:hypothetical protein